MKRYGVLMSLLVVGLAQSAWAASPGTVLIDPFDPGVSAAVSGMGGASSTMGGLWALTYNPAGLADVKDRPEATFYEFQVGASYLKWFEDQAVGYGTVALPPGFALGVANFDQGQITSQTGFFTGGTEKISDFGIIGGYGTALPGQMSNVDVGISAQFWQRNLASFKASTFAVNLGARAMFLEKQFAVGAYVQNLGPSLKFETSEEDPWLMGALVRCADGPGAGKGGARGVGHAAIVASILADAGAGDLPWADRRGGSSNRARPRSAEQRNRQIS